MKILVAGNNKGGVGKTFISSQVAEYAAKFLNKRVLLIDFDPQCNLSQRYLDMDIDPHNEEGVIPPIHPDYDPATDGNEGRSSVADIFYGEHPSIWPYPTYIKNLDIVPASGKKLLAAEAVRQAEVVEKVYDRFKKILTSPAVQESYDLVVIDTAPSKGPLTLSAIRVATDLLIPTLMEDKPLQGTYGMASVWLQESTRTTREYPLKLVGILVNLFDNRTVLHNDLYEGLRTSSELGKHVIPFKINRRIIYAENDQKGSNPRSIFDLNDSNKIARDECKQVCEYITKRIFNDEQ